MAIEQKILTFGTNKVGTIGGKLMGYTSFFPTNITGLFVWLNNDADTMTMSGANKVSEWRDISGNSNHFTQGTGANQPLFVANGINGQNGVYFDNNRIDFLNCTFASPLSQIFTIITVWNLDANSTRSVPVLYDAVSVEANRVVQYWSTNKIDVGSPTPINAYTKTRPFGLIQNLVEFNSTSTKVYENGILQNTVNTGVSDLTSLRLGNLRGASSSTYQLSGYICEQIIYDKQLSDSEKILINDYLTLKYGL